MPRLPFILVCCFVALAAAGCMRRESPVASSGPVDVDTVPAQPRGLAQNGLGGFAAGFGSRRAPVAVAAAPVMVAGPVAAARVIAEPQILTPPVQTASAVMPAPVPVSSRGAYVDVDTVPAKPRGIPLRSFAPGPGPRPATPDVLTPSNRGVVPPAGGPPPVAYAPNLSPPDYRLDAGDRLRIVVFGQEGLSNSYAVDVNGTITMPLIGAVMARGCTPAELAGIITAKLRDGYIREPYVAAEVEAYRPFFILGEVAAPGQYPFVPNLTVESAVAIAGGFSPRARRDSVQITRSNASGSVRTIVPLQTPLAPGDSIVIGERWF